MKFDGFIKGSAAAARKYANCESCVNLYPEAYEAGTGRNGEVARLVRRAGRSLFASTGTLHRGLIAIPGATERAFEVIDGTLYELDSAGTRTSRGTLSTSSGRVSMASNGSQICIVDGTAGYLFTLATNALATISAAGFPNGATHVAFLDGYFIVNQGPTSRQFQISALYDGATWDAADVAGTSRVPDTVIGLWVDHQQLILVGRRSIEIWEDTGNADFPFEPIGGAALEKGMVAPFAGGKLDNTFTWLEGDEFGNCMIFKIAGGYQAQRLSTHTVETWLNQQNRNRLAQATVFTWQFGGHSFWQLNVPGSDRSWVYDFATQIWHERTYNNGGVLERDRAEAHMFVFGKHLVADYSNANLYEVKDDVYTDNGVEIVCERTAAHLSTENKNLFISEFTLDVETGAATTTLYESDGTTERAPRVMLSVSKDGGQNFSVERMTSLGKIGERNVRAIWRRLGKARDWVFRVRISDAVPFVITGAFLEAEAGRS